MVGEQVLALLRLSPRCFGGGDGLLQQDGLGVGDIIGPGHAFVLTAQAGDENHGRLLAGHGDAGLELPLGRLSYALPVDGDRRSLLRGPAHCHRAGREISCRPRLRPGSHQRRFPGLQDSREDLLTSRAQLGGALRVVRESADNPARDALAGLRGVHLARG